MNIHHLELFYYVAKYGGIMAAVRHMPYGIQQPAISAQIAQLEDALGMTLFQRQPFKLSPAGSELYKFIRPFFDNLDAVEQKLRSGGAPHFRFGASGTVLRDYFPPLATNVRQQFPNLKMSLREGHQPQLLHWLQQRELDMAITVLDGKPPAGLRAKALVELPLVLLVDKTCRYTTPKQLWACDRIEETLISLPAHEGISRHFQRGLARLGVDWFPGIEVTSLDLIETYVNNGYGFGVSVADPRHKHPPNVRALPLEGFPPVMIGVMWQGPLTAVMQAFVKAMKEVARQLAG